MKIEITKEQLEEVTKRAERNSVAKWFAARENMKFAIGDILIKHRLVYDYNSDTYFWTPERINSASNMAQRYIYFYEDQYGIGYIRPLKVTVNEPGQAIFALTDFDYSSTRFEVDPEFAEQTLLGGEFDLKELHKRSLEQRKIIQKMNRKIGIKPKLISEFNAFFESLKIDDTFYTSGDFTGRDTEEYKITKKVKVTKKELLEGGNWTWKNHIYSNNFDADYTYKFKYEGAFFSEYILPLDVGGTIFYKTKPVAEEK